MHIAGHILTGICISTRAGTCSVTVLDKFVRDNIGFVLRSGAGAFQVDMGFSGVFRTVVVGPLSGFRADLDLFMAVAVSGRGSSLHISNIICHVALVCYLTQTFLCK